MMHIGLIIALLVGGVALGLLYFGGLWLTIRRVVDARWPKSMLLVSFLGRTIVILAGFYGMAQVVEVPWVGFALGVLGFMGGRLALLRTLGPSFPTTVHKIS